MSKIRRKLWKTAVGGLAILAALIAILANWEAALHGLKRLLATL